MSEQVEEQDEKVQTSPIVINETVSAEKAAQKLSEQQRFAKEQHAHKLARERGFELPENKQPIKAFDLSKSKQKESESDEDDDDEGEEQINVDDRLFVRKEVEPAYARHDKLMADGVSHRMFSVKAFSI